MPTDKDNKALAALDLIISKLLKRNFRWCITGGFACYEFRTNRFIVVNVPVRKLQIFLD